MRGRLHRNPTEYVWRAMADALWNSRSRLATHLNTNPERLVFFSNISQAINTFCLSVDLPRGADVLLSDHEYGAMRWAWDRAAKMRGWNIVPFTIPIASEDPQTIVGAVEKRNDQQHQAVVFEPHFVLDGTGPPHERDLPPS
jgi:isopenicillin-N epimerase